VFVVLLYVQVVFEIRTSDRKAVTALMTGV
jgi:hypothetical protein